MFLYSVREFCVLVVGYSCTVFVRRTSSRGAKIRDDPTFYPLKPTIMYKLIGLRGSS